MDNFLIGIFIFVVIFLLLREFWTWYLKINKIVKTLEEKLAEQKKTNKLLNTLIKELQDNTPKNT